MSLEQFQPNTIFLLTCQAPGATADIGAKGAFAGLKMSGVGGAFE